jgi:hypothetical protein
MVATTRTLTTSDDSFTGCTGTCGTKICQHFNLPLLATYVESPWSSDGAGDVSPLRSLTRRDGGVDTVDALGGRMKVGCYSHHHLHQHCSHQEP